MALTSQQLNFSEENGYLIVAGLIGSDEVNNIWEHFMSMQCEVFNIDYPLRTHPSLR